MRSHILSMLGALGLLLSPLGVSSASAITCTPPSTLVSGVCKIVSQKPTKKCSKGKILDQATGTCVADPNAPVKPKRCGKGSTYDATTKTCVRDKATVSKQCAKGASFDPTTNKCVRDKKAPAKQCAKGATFDPTTNKCVRDKKAPTKQCPGGGTFVNGKCTNPASNTKTCRINPKVFTLDVNGKKVYACAAPGISTGPKPPTTCPTTDGKNCTKGV